MKNDTKHIIDNKKRSMSISSNESYEKDKEYNDNYRQENMENDVKNEITAMKKNIENYLNKLDNEIKNKIISNIFNGISKTNISKCLYIKEQINLTITSKVT